MAMNPMYSVRGMSFVHIGQLCMPSCYSKRLHNRDACRVRRESDEKYWVKRRWEPARMGLTVSKASGPWEALYEKYTKAVYTGDWMEDLLIAVKYDDMDKFLTILDTVGSEAVNKKWGGRRFNQSVLLAAASRGRTNMVLELISRGADCTHRNDLGWGAVRYTRNYYDVLAMPEGPSLIQLMIKNGARNESRVGEPLPS